MSHTQTRRSHEQLALHQRCYFSQIKQNIYAHCLTKVIADTKNRLKVTKYKHTKQYCCMSLWYSAYTNCLFSFWPPACLSILVILWYDAYTMCSLLRIVPQTFYRKKIRCSLLPWAAESKQPGELLWLSGYHTVSSKSYLYYTLTDVVQSVYKFFLQLSTFQQLVQLFFCERNMLYNDSVI